MTLIQVALPYRIPKALTYELPPSLRAEPGSRLLVPLGNRKVIGCLVGESREAPPAGLKSVLEVLDEEPLLTPSQSKLLVWASHYYLTPIGEVLRHLLPPSLFRKTTLSRRKIKSLPDHADFATRKQVRLTPEQEAVFKDLALDPPRPYLLFGITGSGKTEIYIRLLQEILERGANALFLVPEIAITPQLIGRLQESLPCPIVPYHSGLTPAQRGGVWEGVRAGGTPVVVGTRSAVFLPFPSLRLIVVDEEHDSSYKQEERFCYNARDLALWRGQEEKATVVLGSATPSLESLNRCRLGKMTLLSLSSRPHGLPPPLPELIDRRSPDNRDHFLSGELQEAIQATLRRGEQTLLFLNRRGFSPFVICRVCGWIPACDDCDISLTFHKKIGSLVCHYCDRKIPFTPLCGRCRRGKLAPEGVGTQRVEEEVRRLFPRARIARIDRDTGTTENLNRVLSQMKKREVDILIGTQILSKGHDYPHLTLVGVIDADTALSLPDFRATERTFQVLTQVAGRSGRGEAPGRVLIQTFNPEHPGLSSLINQTHETFIALELRNRESSLYPPYCRLIRIVFSGKRADRVEKGAKSAASELKKIGPLIIGPAPCPHTRIRGKSRWHLLIKSRSFATLHSRLEPLLDDLSQHRLPSGVRMLVDVDPITML